MEAITDNKERILEAAKDLFLEKGLAGTSTSMIAKKAGVAKSLIHHHFHSKADLWIAVKARFLQSLVDMYVQLLQGDAPTAEVIRESFAKYFTFLSENPGHVRLLAWASVEEEPLFPSTDSLTAQAVGWIQRQQQNGVIRTDLDSRALLLSFFNVVEGWFVVRSDLKRSIYGGGMALSKDSRKSEMRSEVAYLQTVVSVFLEGALSRH